MQIRKAEKQDIPAVAAIFSAIHSAEEKGELTIGWVREIYPTEETARAALIRNDLFVMEKEGAIVASAIINRLQVPDYAKGQWLHAAHEDEVMVLIRFVFTRKLWTKAAARHLLLFMRRMPARTDVRIFVWIPTPSMQLPALCTGNWGTERRGSFLVFLTGSKVLALYCWKNI